MGVDIIEESSVRLLASSSGGSSGSRWVDGNEVEWEVVPLPKESENEGLSSIRRRLVKKPKRVDSLDVESMEIFGKHDHHSKVVSSTS